MISETLCLPSPDPEIRREYQQLIADIDQRVQQLTAGRLSKVCRCGPGCADCCMAFSVLPLEAALLSEALSAAGKAVEISRQEGQCVFLRNGLCSLYLWRPVICRTQGMALAYVDQSTQSIDVSACELNFPPDAALEHEDLLFMDQYNERLAALNLRYCRQNNLAVERRIALADIPVGR